MDPKAPKIDPRTFRLLLQQLRDLAPHYIPEWQSEEETAAGGQETESGTALMKIFSQMAETVISRLNLAPQRNFVYFLDMLGIKLLPALPARVPLTFKLAPGPDQGLGRELLVPLRTQATADATEERPEQLPFETEEDLLVTPSLLTQVIAVDPLQDAIYQPPPGFLERPLPVQSQTKYKIISFSLAGSDTLQLDTVAGLKEGDLLRVGPMTSGTSSDGMQCGVSLNDDDSLNAGAREAADFFYIEEIKGSIVKIKNEKLPHDYQPETPVEKVVKFHLFESKNLQEHVLYLGHSDLFNIKSPAEFTLQITHLAGTATGVQPLQIVWEYWGQSEGQEGEDWRPFEVTGDGSVNLSRDGAITLLKAGEGEITARKVNDVESRWIRCRLKESLPENDDRRLPVLDNIAFRVKSGGEFFADQAFNNDTPLDVALPFLPFGSVPRLFDRFYLASKEAFSKKGAQITLNISVDTTGVLAAPAAMALTDSTIRLYARGTQGRLIELRINPFDNDALPTPSDRGFPPDTVLALPNTKQNIEAIPSIVRSADGKYISVFARAENGRLVELYYVQGAESYKWIVHPALPNNIAVKFDPSAIEINSSNAGNQVNVYVIGDDRKLYFLTRDQSKDTKGNDSSVWQPLDGPVDAALDSSPVAGIAEGIIKVLAKGQDKNLYEWDEGEKQQQKWKKYNLSNTGQPGIDSKPFAFFYSETSVKLDNNTSDKNGAYVNVMLEITNANGILEQRRITGYDGPTRTATVEPWTIVPEKNKPYTIKNNVAGTIIDLSGKDKTIVLDNNALPQDDNSDIINDGIYKGQRITLRNANNDERILTISEYSALGRVVSVTAEANWNQGFLPGDSYEIGDLSGIFAEKATQKAYAKVYVKDDTGPENAGLLWELDTKNQIPNKLGSPNDKIKVASSAHGYFEGAGANAAPHIFVRGTDNMLWEWAVNWEPHGSALNTQLHLSPFVVSTQFNHGADDAGELISVFSGSNKNSVIEKRFLTPGEMTGTPQVGTRKTITLGTDTPGSLTLERGMQIEIADGKGKSQRKVIGSYDSDFKLAILDEGELWDEDNLPDTTSKYKITKKTHTAQVLDATFLNVDLQENLASKKPSAYKGFEIEISNILTNEQIKIDEYDGAAQTAKVKLAVDVKKTPAQNPDYKILTATDGEAQEVQPAHVRFPNDASISNNERHYRGRTITIRPEDEPQTILAYDEAERLAIVEKNWDVVPQAGRGFDVVAFKGTIESAANPTVILNDQDAIKRDILFKDLIGFAIQINGQSYKIVDYIESKKEATLAQAWTQLPKVGDAYTIGELVAGDAQILNSYTIKLALPDEDNRNYQGFFITIPASGDGETLRIDNYKDKTATVAELSITEPTTNYRIQPISGVIKNFSDGPFVTLDENAPPITDLFKDLLIKIPAEIGAGQINIIKGYDKNTRQATVEKAWTPLPQKGDKYAIDIAHPGKVKATQVANNKIALADHALEEDDVYKNLFVKITSGPGASEENLITEYDGETKIATVKQAWQTKPTERSEYIIVTKGKINTATNAYIKLDANDDKASKNPGVYENLKINFPGLNNLTRTITDYAGDSKIATVDRNWDFDNVPPDKANYKIGDHTGKVRGDVFSSVMIDEPPTSVSIKNEDEMLFTKPGSAEILRVIKKIVKLNGQNKLIIFVDQLWSLQESPNDTYAYTLRKVILTGAAQVGIINTMTLGNTVNASQIIDRDITITTGPGSRSDPKSRKIVAYKVEYNIITVFPEWNLTDFPDSKSTYLISGTSDDKWREYADPVDVTLIPELSWEYWNSKGWVVLKKETEHKFSDSTKNLLIDGEIRFLLPDDLDKTDVSGQENLWIRARIVSGDYGRETFILEEQVGQKDDKTVKETRLIPIKRDIRPPFIVSLTIKYELLKNQFPQQCLPFNNLQYIDQTAACITRDKQFLPFEKLEDSVKTIYLGFNQAFKGGPIKIFFIAQELPFSETEKPKMVWSYRGENEWKRLSVDDATEGLIKQEILKLISEKDLTILRRFGSELYWIRGGLTAGRYLELPVLDGIYPNTTWTFQAETFRNEILGSSDGEPNQVFQFQNFPILAGEEKRGLKSEDVRVQEVLTNEEREALQKNFGEESVFDEKDENGEIIRTWVLWQEAPGFFDSTPADRHYTLDRATGQLQFGDGQNGRIPPASLDTIQAFSYQAAIGGAKGNVKAGEIQTLVTATAGVDAVINTVDAGGGTDTATLAQMLQIGPAMISHKGRAVTAEDFEWLAKQASREVFKARCLANVNAQKQNEIGWVSVYIVPNLPEMEMPMPSLELRRSVQRYLEARGANTIASLRHINVEGPVYQQVSVAVEVIVDSIDVAARVDQDVRAKLKKFFHPLTGGPNNDGWDFGRDVSVSDVYALLEDVEGVDHVEGLKFNDNGAAEAGVVAIKPNFLVANGEHTINIKLRSATEKSF